MEHDDGGLSGSKPRSSWPTHCFFLLGQSHEQKSAPNGSGLGEPADPRRLREAHANKKDTTDLGTRPKIPASKAEAFVGYASHAINTHKDLQVWQPRGEGVLGTRPEIEFFPRVMDCESWSWILAKAAMASSSLPGSMTRFGLIGCSSSVVLGVGIASWKLIPPCKRGGWTCLPPFQSWKSTPGLPNRKLLCWAGSQPPIGFEAAATAFCRASIRFAGSGLFWTSIL